MFHDHWFDHKQEDIFLDQSLVAEKLERSHKKRHLVEIN